jgi:hypothetical protein
MDGSAASCAASTTSDCIDKRLECLVDHLGGHLAWVRIAAAPGSGTVSCVLDSQRFQVGQDLRHDLAGIDCAEHLLRHGLDDHGRFRIAIGKPAQDDKRVIAKGPWCSLQISSLRSCISSLNWKPRGLLPQPPQQQPVASDVVLVDLTSPTSWQLASRRAGVARSMRCGHQSIRILQFLCEVLARRLRSHGNAEPAALKAQVEK